MKNILISFIRNNHLEMQKEGDLNNLDITQVVRDSSISRLFLLTNKDRDESINFKNWISDKLDIEVKAVTLEKGSEKYILKKIESIIKYILLAEEGHARFFYLPGENTLQINLWEIVNQNIYKGKIIYPISYNTQNELPKGGKTEQAKIKNISVKKEKIVPASIQTVTEKMSEIEKGIKAIDKGLNLLICGEEGTGKQTLAGKILSASEKEFHLINFRTLNPAKSDSEFKKIIEEIHTKDFKLLLLLNIETLPLYIQEQFVLLKNIQIISTFNTDKSSILDNLNKRFYYLISSTMIPLLPLRAKKEEIPQLTEIFLKQNNSNTVVSENALSLLKSHNWPGNLNELQSVLSRASMESAGVLTSELIENSLDKRDIIQNEWNTTPIDENFKLNDIMGDVAMHYIVQALEIAEGKKSKAARLLGFSNYQTLSNWIKKYQK